MIACTEHMTLSSQPKVHEDRFMLRPKLHYTDTGYGHVVQQHQRTPPTDELAKILQQICHIAMPEPNISTCQDVGCDKFLSVGGEFVAQQVVSSSVGGIRSRYPCSGVWA